MSCAICLSCLNVLCPHDIVFTHSIIFAVFFFVTERGTYLLPLKSQHLGHFAPNCWLIIVCISPHLSMDLWKDSFSRDNRTRTWVWSPVLPSSGCRRWGRAGRRSPRCWASLSRCRASWRAGRRPRPSTCRPPCGRRWSLCIGSGGPARRCWRWTARGSGRPGERVGWRVWWSKNKNQYTVI